MFTVLRLSKAMLLIGAIGVFMVMLDGLVWGLMASLIFLAVTILCIIGTCKQNQKVLIAGLLVGLVLIGFYFFGLTLYYELVVKLYKI